MKVSFVCGRDGFRDGVVRVNGEVIPNRTIREVTDTEVYTKSGFIKGSVHVTLFNGDVEIPEDLYRSMYPE